MARRVFGAFCASKSREERSPGSWAAAGVAPAEQTPQQARPGLRGGLEAPRAGEDLTALGPDNVKNFSWLGTLGNFPATVVISANMALSGHRLDPDGAVKWHRIGGLELPGWSLVRDAFLLYEQRGWRRELAQRLHMAPANVTRLLRVVARPNYVDYLVTLAFLEGHGVLLFVQVPGA